MTGGFDAAALVARLHDCGVRYLIVGGFAVDAHGVQRATRDLDVCPEPTAESYKRLAALLVEIGAQHVGLSDFDSSEFPFDPRRADELAEGGSFRR